MKKFFLFLMLTIFSVSVTCFGGTELEYYPVDIPLKKLLKQPTPESEVALEFPINVKIVGVSKDSKWYKVHISYDLVFFGKYTFNGWVNADVFNKIKDAALTVEAY